MGRRPTGSTFDFLACVVLSNSSVPFTLLSLLEGRKEGRVAIEFQDRGEED